MKLHEEQCPFQTGPFISMGGGDLISTFYYLGHQNVWLLGCKSKLSTSNKLLVYKTTLKPIWTYKEILERFQSKALHMMVDTPSYMPNMVFRRDLRTPTVKEEIRRQSSRYSARLSAHPNDVVVNLMVQHENRRL
jgi:hypothetical protein